MNRLAGVKIRVLVVEDSLTVRRYLREVLAADPGVEVVGEAGDGKEAIAAVMALRPDVITLDMMLPVMSGLAATEYIMAHRPTPILIVSSSTNRGELFKTYEALAAGAVEVLEKPWGEEPDGAWEANFLSTLKLVSRIRVITHPRARLSALAARTSAEAAPPAAALPGPDAARIRAARVVALGASTGGPRTLVEILRVLPSPYPVPLLVALHIGEPFGAAFAEWLDGQTSHRAAFGREGERLAETAGRVILAPPDRHLRVEDGRLRLSDDPPRHSCRPSVDVLFESLCAACGAETVACLLTGMGRDGAEGLLEIRRAGGFTVAQDEATSVVYGMPRAAVEQGAAMRVLGQLEIGTLLASVSR